MVGRVKSHEATDISSCLAFLEIMHLHAPSMCCFAQVGWKGFSPIIPLIISKLGEGVIRCSQISIDFAFVVQCVSSLFFDFALVNF